MALKTLSECSGLRVCCERGKLKIYCTLTTSFRAAAVTLLMWEGDVVAGEAEIELKYFGIFRGGAHCSLRKVAEGLVPMYRRRYSGMSVDVVIL